MDTAEASAKAAGHEISIVGWCRHVRSDGVSESTVVFCNVLQQSSKNEDTDNDDDNNINERS